MPAILAGHVTAFFLYAWPRVNDLSAVAALIGGATDVRLTPKTTTPSYVQYKQPPLTIDGGAIGLPEAIGFGVRFKLFDYGVMSVALSRALPGTWPGWSIAGLPCRTIRFWLPPPSPSAGI